jgi:hypothetical protein
MRTAPLPLLRGWPKSGLLPVTTERRIIRLRLSASFQRPGGSVRSQYVQSRSQTPPNKPKRMGAKVTPEVTENFFRFAIVFSDDMKPWRAARGWQLFVVLYPSWITFHALLSDYGPWCRGVLRHYDFRFPRYPGAIHCMETSVTPFKFHRPTYQY